jgi:hypothetical protein
VYLRLQYLLHKAQFPLILSLKTTTFHFLSSFTTTSSKEITFISYQPTGLALSTMAPIIAGISTGLLAPVVALNIWTFGMEAWMYATRIPAVKKYGADMRSEATKEGQSISTFSTVKYNHFSFIRSPMLLNDHVSLSKFPSIQSLSPNLFQSLKAAHHHVRFQTQ